MTNKIIGIILISATLSIILASAAIEIGLMETIIVFLGASACTALIVCGVWLITKDIKD